MDSSDPLAELLGQLLATQVAIRGMIAASPALHLAAEQELERFAAAGLFSASSDATLAGFEKARATMRPNAGSPRPTL